MEAVVSSETYVADNVPPHATEQPNGKEIPGGSRRALGSRGSQNFQITGT